MRGAADVETPWVLICSSCCDVVTRLPPPLSSPQYTACLLPLKHGGRQEVGAGKIEVLRQRLCTVGIRSQPLAVLRSWSWLWFLAGLWPWPRHYLGRELAGQRQNSVGAVLMLKKPECHRLSPLPRSICSRCEKWLFPRRAIVWKP